jgi:hypothetical protein
LGTGTLVGGGPGSTFTVDITDFNYNPNLGNLLMDIKIPGGVSPNSNGPSFEARSGTADGIFSRLHNFGTGFEGWGLVTQFETASQSMVPEPSSLAIFALGGIGMIGIGQRRKRKQKA